MKQIIVFLLVFLFLSGCSSLYKSISTKDHTIDTPCIIWYEIIDKKENNVLVCKDAFGEVFEPSVSDAEYVFAQKGMWFVVTISGPR